ncbi:MAG: cysteine desulfurase [Rhizobiales bacterium TMED83]|jgi:cysteine desulfurase|nr:cysteine desulfurase [Rhodobiaceae bacterium]RPF92493.1 MAG: cysteine desulfurase [Rhizobiales bacterium TMED83]
MSRVYLDYNATAPIRPQVQDAVAQALGFGNASAVHAEGRRARAAVETARASLAEFCGAVPEGIVFTSGGTEACNLALGMRAAPAGKIQRILTSAVEHAAVGQAAAASGLVVDVVPVDENGVIDLTALDAALSTPDPALVCVMVANNETGVLQPIHEIAERVAAHGSLLFCDGVQAAGKIPLSLEVLACDALAVSAHKIGGPMGVGALLTRPGLVVSPNIFGGGQELGRRGGSENVAGIVGFGLAAKLSADELARAPALGEKRDRLETDLRAGVPEIRIFGADAPRLSNTSCFGLAGLHSETVVMALDLAGISVSAGAACSSGKVSRSHVLDAMGVEHDVSSGAIRVSLGRDTNDTDCDRLVESWLKLASKLEHAAAQ